MVQIKTIDRTPVEDCGIVKTRKCCNRSRPFFNWVVQQRLAAKLCELVRHLLRRRCSFEDDPYFVGKCFGSGSREPITALIP